MAPGPVSGRQMLVFDADDTLWENNVLFERAISGFLDWLDHPTMSRTEIRTVLDGIERVNAVSHGYGSEMFLLSLGHCVERLYGRPVTGAERRRLEELASAVVRSELELIPGVPETLEELSARHHLVLLTKGDVAEQQRKLDASRLARHFRGVHIVAEKDAGTYERLARESTWPPEASWMIGNSPKSDIVPARRAGMNAVFIPNDHTWVLEHDEWDADDDRVLRLAEFPELLDHF